VLHCKEVMLKKAWKLEVLCVRLSKCQIIFDMSWSYNLYIIKGERLIMLKLKFKLASLFNLITTPLLFISSKP
jgi:hypothetical protein